MTISQRVKASQLEEVDLGRTDKPRTVNVAKELPKEEKKAMVALLTDFKDVFAWSWSKALSRFLGQIRWHSRMIRHLADFATPLHTAVHRVPFQWAETEEKAY